MPRRSSASDLLPVAFPGGRGIRCKGPIPAARADSHGVSGGRTAFPADRGGDRDARRYPKCICSGEATCRGRLPICDELTDGIDFDLECAGKANQSSRHRLNRND